MPDDDSIQIGKEINPIPERGDQLFVLESRSHHNAQLNHGDDDDTLYRYVLGYKEAADRLVHSLLEDRRHIDLVIFPTVFLYRQYIELRLKQLLKEGNRLLDREFKFPTHHRIDNLWNECKSLLKQIEPTMKDKEVEALGECINEFSAVDPVSMAFRYHVDKHNNPSLPPDLRFINISHLAQIMEKMHAFFDAAYMVISVLLDKKSDFLQMQYDMNTEIEEAFKDYYPSEEDWREYYGMPDE